MLSEERSKPTPFVSSVFSGPMRTVSKLLFKKSFNFSGIQLGSLLAIHWGFGCPRRMIL